MNVRVITSAPSTDTPGYHAFCDTYQGPRVNIYVEDMEEAGRACETWSAHSLWEIPGCKQFVDFTAMLPACNNQWQFDVNRFCRKVFVMCHEVQNMADDDRLFWFDADVTWKAPLREETLIAALDGQDMCYLGRQNYHPCTSFIGFGPGAKPFMSGLMKLYTSTMFLRMHEWHDAYIFGEMLKGVPPFFKVRNLTPEGQPVENVFDRVWRGIAEHHKGPGKFADHGRVQSAASETA